MKSLDTKELEKLSDADLIRKLSELRSEFSRLRSGAARGTLKKELGEIKTVRRNVARVLTVMNARSGFKSDERLGGTEKAQAESATSGRQKE